MPYVVVIRLIGAVPGPVFSTAAIRRSSDVLSVTDPESNTTVPGWFGRVTRMRYVPGAIVAGPSCSPKA